MASRSWNSVLRFIRRTMSAPGGADATDPHLLARYTLDRDQAAFEALVRRHGPMVLGVCRRLLRDEHLAEDAFQATFLVLARKAGSIGQAAALGGWLYRVAYHIGLRAKRQSDRRRARERPIEEVAPKEPVPAGIGPELRRALDEEVNRLPEKYRAAIILCYWEGKTYEQAAALLGCPRGTISGRLARARELLRSRLSRRGLALPAGALAAGLSQAPVSAAVGATLIHSTVTGALRFASRKAVVAGVSTQAAALAEEALRTMFVAKPQLLIALLVALGVVGTVAGVVAHHFRNSAPEKAPLLGDQQSVTLPPGALARMGRVRLKHSAGVTGFALSADGKLVASAGQDKTIRLWDVATGLERRRFALEGQRFDVYHVGFSPDGKILATGSQSPTIHIWDVATGKGLGQILLPGRSAFPEFVFTPNSKALLSWTGSTIHLWDVPTGRQIREWEGPRNGGSACLALSPDGQTLATRAAPAPTIFLWNMDTGEVLRQFPENRSGTYALAFSPDSRSLASGHMKEVRVWDVATGKERLQLGGDMSVVLGVAFSVDGLKVAAASNDGQCRVWNGETGSELQRFRLMPKPKDLANPVPKLHFSNDAMTLAWSSWDSGNGIHLSDVASGNTLEPTGSEPYLPGPVTFSPNGDKLVSQCEGGNFCLWEAATGSKISDLKRPNDYLASMVFSPDGKSLIALGRAVHFWDLTSGQMLGRLDPGPQDISHGSALALSSDCLTLAVGEKEGSKREPLKECKIELWDLETGRQVRSFERAHRGSIMALAFSLDNKTLASSGQDQQIRVWDVTTGKQRLQFEASKEPAASLTFSSAGATLLSAHSFFEKDVDTFRIAVWDIATAKQRHQVLGPPGGAKFSAFSGDGKALAFLDRSRTIHVWETDTGKQARQLKGHESEILFVVFSPDGKKLASGSRDTGILVWDLSRPER